MTHEEWLDESCREDAERDRRAECRDENDVPPDSGPLDELEGPPYDAEDDSWID